PISRPTISGRLSRKRKSNMASIVALRPKGGACGLVRRGAPSRGKVVRDGQIEPLEPAADLLRILMNAMPPAHLPLEVAHAEHDLRPAAQKAAHRERAGEVHAFEVHPRVEFGLLVRADQFE